VIDDNAKNEWSYTFNSLYAFAACRDPKLTTCFAKFILVLRRHVLLAPNTVEIYYHYIGHSAFYKKKNVRFKLGTVM
jgi:hypothetical protein